MDEIFQALNGSYTKSGHRVIVEGENNESDNLWLWYHAPEQPAGGDEVSKIGIARVRFIDAGCVVELLRGSDPRPRDVFTFDDPEDALDFLRDEIARN